MEVTVSIHIDEINVTPTNIAQAVACADDEEQAEFLAAFARKANEYAWDIQCRYIAAEIDASFPNSKTEIANTLRNLIEHIEELPS